MPNWTELLFELQRSGSTHDLIRRRYIAALSDFTGRNTIIYYSAWLQKAPLVGQNPEAFSINDQDKNAFMATIHQMDRTKGLDLILHTPGGDVAASESLVSYLRAMFDTNIRVIVPQLALSAGTMISCAAREIVMGLHSSLGPIDPQLNGLPAHGVVEEFQQAAKEIKADPSKVDIWRPIIEKYHPTFIGECQKAIKWSSQMVSDWLITGMFAGMTKPGPKARANRVLKELADHSLTLSHSRHIDFQKAEDIGLNVTALEVDNDLQDAVLTVHHIATHTLDQTAAIKIIENQMGVAMIQRATVMAVPPVTEAPRTMGRVKRTRQPADLNRLAASIVAEATADEAESESPQAQAGRLGGLKGGRARAKSLSPERRREIARNAAKARWSKS